LHINGSVTGHPYSIPRRHPITSKHVSWRAAKLDLPLRLSAVKRYLAMTASGAPSSDNLARDGGAQANRHALLQLDPKKIRATKFKNRDDRSLLLHDPKFIQLTKSLAAHGQETPIRVRPVRDALPFEFEIVSGHRRH